MQINPYLFYDSNCEAAFKYYEKVLGGKIEMMLRNEEAPEPMPGLPGQSLCISSCGNSLNRRKHS